MIFAVFHRDKKRVFWGKRGTKSKFDHRFGGSVQYAGLRAFPRRLPVHLLIRLNTADACVGVRLSTAQWLPLLCAIRYGACELGYRVLSDNKVKILHQGETKVWRGFPSKEYPTALPAKPMDLREGIYDPGDPQNALMFGGVFGYDALTRRQFANLVKYVEQEDLPDMVGCESAEEYLEGNGWPFLQGPPEDGCPDPTCRLHDVTGGLRTFALFQEEDRGASKLWGPNGENLQIVYQICPDCSAILTTHQCT